jgi:TonB dependent receptor
MTGAQRRATAVVASALAVWFGFLSSPRAQVATVDSVRTAESWAHYFERIARDRYLRRHAFSLDHYLEFEPGGFVTRLGPIGSDAFYSRWGIGRGRALLRINGIPLNNPQDDSPPLLHTPTSGLGSLSLSSWAGVAWIEGVVELDEAAPPSGRPNTFVELSKGTHAVRQRRVRFSSEASKVGIDLAYDEVLDDGYAFDASGVVPDIPDYGSAQSRQSTIVVRGDPDAATRFAMGVRGYTSTTQGDLTSNTSAGRESGHVAWLDAAVDNTKLTLFARGYSSSVPDSSSENETVGAIGSWSVAGANELRLRAGVESIDGTQHIDSLETRDRIVRATGDLGASRCGEHAFLTASGTVASDEETPLAWGAAVGAGWKSTHQRWGVSAARSFRLPNLSERYLPAHASGGTTLVGDADLDPETAWEVGGHWALSLGASTSFVNRVRASWVRSEDAIAFRPVAWVPDSVRVASNASAMGEMWFVEDRMHGEWNAFSLHFLADAAALYTSGDRVDAFVAVPKLQVNASLLFGRSFFEATSALYLGAQFLAVDDRSDYDGVPLPNFQVVNLLLEGRLLDARLYLQYLNVLDEVYQTQGNYLMTPATFVYGIEWTLFN